MVVWLETWLIKGVVAHLGLETWLIKGVVAHLDGCLVREDMID